MKTLQIIIFLENLKNRSISNNQSIVENDTIKFNIIKIGSNLLIKKSNTIKYLTKVIYYF